MNLAELTAAVAELRRRMVEHDRIAFRHRELGKPRADWRVKASTDDRALLGATELLWRKAKETK